MSSYVDDRKIWTVSIPAGDEYGVGPVEVLIEQFGDGLPTVSFRRGGSQAVWSEPFQGVPG